MSPSNSNPKTDPKFVRAFERGVLRSSFVSLFWAVIQERKKKGAFTLQGLAKALSTNKAEVSRWFKGDPNWTVNTIAGIANALEIDLRIEAVDRATGQIYTAAGPKRAPVAKVTATPDDEPQFINFRRVGNDAETSTDGSPPPLRLVA